MQGLDAHPPVTKPAPMSEGDWASIPRHSHPRHSKDWFERAMPPKKKAGGRWKLEEGGRVKLIPTTFSWHRLSEPVRESPRMLMLRTQCPTASTRAYTDRRGDRASSPNSWGHRPSGPVPESPRMLMLRFHGFPWISIDFHGFPWISTDFIGFPWISTDFHAFPRISINFH